MPLHFAIFILSFCKPGKCLFFWLYIGERYIISKWKLIFSPEMEIVNKNTFLFLGTLLYDSFASLLQRCYIHLKLRPIFELALKDLGWRIFQIIVIFQDSGVWLCFPNVPATAVVFLIQNTFSLLSHKHFLWFILRGHQLKQLNIMLLFCEGWGGSAKQLSIKKNRIIYKSNHPPLWYCHWLYSECQ